MNQTVKHAYAKTNSSIKQDDVKVDGRILDKNIIDLLRSFSLVVSEDELIDPYTLSDECVLTAFRNAIDDYLEMNKEEKKPKPFNRNEWAKNILNQYPWACFTPCQTANIRPIIVVSLVDKKTGYYRHGMAVCSEKDKYDSSVGAAVAICHALNIPVPKEV